MNFMERKLKGNATEQRFQQEYPNAIRTSSFAEDDFTTTTGDLPDEIKYRPDFIDEDVYVEVKSSIFYNAAEYYYHASNLPDMDVYIINKRYKLCKLCVTGPYPGSRRGSGLPYMRVELP